MNFTEWLKRELPHLQNESSAITFNYIQNAKKSTAKLRMLITFLNIIFTVIIGYGIGFLLGFYTDLDLSIIVGITVGISFLFTSNLEDKLKYKVIQNKLLEMAKKIPNNNQKSDS